MKPFLFEYDEFGNSTRLKYMLVYANDLQQAYQILGALVFPSGTPPNAIRTATILPL